MEDCKCPPPTLNLLIILSRDSPLGSVLVMSPDERGTSLRPTQQAMTLKQQDDFVHDGPHALHLQVDN